MVVAKDDASSSSYTLPTENSTLIPKPNQQNLSSQSKTFANVFMAIVGAGVLGLPYTFKRTGWLTGSLMLFSVAFLTYYCMMSLVYTRRRLETLNGFSKINSFGDLGFAVSGSSGRLAVDVMIVLSQAGFCVSYLIFVANTLAYIFNDESKVLGVSAKAVYIWGCFPFQLGLNSIPTLTHLAPLSIFAGAVDLGAMGVVIVEDVIVFMHKMPVTRAFAGFSNFFYGLGVSVYAFEGIGMVLPLESEIREKEKFGTTLAWSMAFISLMFGAFGILGYFAFGENTKDIITTNLGAGLLSTLVQLGLCVNLFFSFPLMMNPVYEVVERRVCEGRYTLWLRWLMVLLLSLIALLVPNFADFLSFVGSSVCVVLGFVLPALFHWMSHKEDMGWKGWLMDAVVVVIGFVIALFGTWSSLVEIFSSKTA